MNKVFDPEPDQYFPGDHPFLQVRKHDNLEIKLTANEMEQAQALQGTKRRTW